MLRLKERVFPAMLSRNAPNKVYFIGCDVHYNVTVIYTPPVVLLQEFTFQGTEE